MILAGWSDLVRKALHGQQGASEPGSALCVPKTRLHAANCQAPLHGSSPAPSHCVCHPWELNCCNVDLYLKRSTSAGRKFAD